MPSKFGPPAASAEENRRWWNSRDGVRMQQNTWKAEREEYFRQAAKEREEKWSEWEARYGGDEEDPWEPHTWRDSRASSNPGSASAKDPSQVWADAWDDNAIYSRYECNLGSPYGTRPNYKGRRESGPYRRSDDGWEVRSDVSKRSSRSLVKVPRGARSGGGSGSGARSEASYHVVEPMDLDGGYGKGEDGRSRTAGNVGGDAWKEEDEEMNVSDAEGARALSLGRADGREDLIRKDAGEHWNVQWDRHARRSRFMEEGAKDTFLDNWYEEHVASLGHDFDPQGGEIPKFYGAAGSAGAIRSCNEEAAMSTAFPSSLEYVCCCCGVRSPHKADLAQMLISLEETRKKAAERPELMPPWWSNPDRLPDKVENLPELAVIGWPRAVLAEVNWIPFAPEAFSVKRALNGEKLPPICESKLGTWRQFWALLSTSTLFREGGPWLVRAGADQP